jgi:hypothetical protein
MISSKVPWLVLADDLPREGEGPPFGTRD